MIRTRKSYLLGVRLPDAHVRIYADANHGLLYQHADLFGGRVRGS